MTHHNDISSPSSLAGNLSNIMPIISEKNLPKSWRITKTVAIPKPEKYPKMASSYRPISLLSMCYKLLERIILHRISPKTEVMSDGEPRQGLRTSLERKQMKQVHSYDLCIYVKLYLERASGGGCVTQNTSRSERME